MFPLHCTRQFPINNVVMEFSLNIYSDGCESGGKIANGPEHFTMLASKQQPPLCCGDKIAEIMALHYLPLGTLANI